MVQKPAEIIETRGGPSKFALAVRREPHVVRAWKFKNKFPRTAWPEISQAFADLDTPTLLEIEKVSGRAA